MDGWVWTVVGVLVGLFIVDRMLLGMESRGWIYWRRTKVRPSGGVGNALQELQSFFQPGQQHVVEAQRDEHEDTEHGRATGNDPPPSGSDKR